jgi:hypothetical protein
VKLVQYHFPTAKTTQPQVTLSTQFSGLCQALALSALPEMTEFACLCEKLSTLVHGNSRAVLDQESGQLLEHHQPRKDPHYKEVWDHSYSKKLGCLCQGNCTGDNAGGKQANMLGDQHVPPDSLLGHPSPQTKIDYLHNGDV